jgi:hypothetical protein
LITEFEGLRENAALFYGTSTSPTPTVIPAKAGTPLSLQRHLNRLHDVVGQGRPKEQIDNAGQMISI